MDEFSLIEQFFQRNSLLRQDVIIGIGDDAACVQVPDASQLLISTDTLVENVHFLNSWDPYDIACRAVKVNISDMAAMAATPAWVSLALTLPKLDQTWLERFSKGLHETLALWRMALIGGDITRGPLTITITIHGFAPTGQVVQRQGALPGDHIYVSGDLGAAAFAVQMLTTPSMANLPFTSKEQALLLNKLLHPMPRTDLTLLLREYASAAIDISDGLSADLQHICEMSRVGAYLIDNDIPRHPLLQRVATPNSPDWALTGGDDYELCFTIPSEKEADFLSACTQHSLRCYRIGIIQSEKGLSIQRKDGRIEVLPPSGYQHF